MRDALSGAPWLGAMARVFDHAGAVLYIVGGAVRNPLMGLPLSDIDVCGPALPDEVCALCQGTEVRAVMRERAFGSVELYITDACGQSQMAEYTTWRTDLYDGGHRPDHVVFTCEIAVDACRRDFSVNALYQRVHETALEPVVDPTGGLDHLRAGVLHTVTENPDEVLKSDGLRILRAARFQAEMGLTLTPSHRDSLCRYAHLLSDIAPERMREEFGKILMADLRYPMLRRSRPATHSGLETLHQIGAWPIVMGSVAYDDHAARSLARFRLPSLSARLALLLHASPLHDACSALEHLRFPAKEIADTLRILQALSADDLLTQAKLGMSALDAAQAVFDALDDQPSAARISRAMEQLRGKPASLRELAVNGNDLKPLFLQQGRPLCEMGSALDGLWLSVLEGRAQNTRENLCQLFLAGV